MLQSFGECNVVFIASWKRNKLLTCLLVDATKDPAAGQDPNSGRSQGKPGDSSECGIPMAFDCGISIHYLF